MEVGGPALSGDEPPPEPVERGGNPLPPVLTPRPPARIMDIIDLVEAYSPDCSEMLTRAYIFTAKVHKGQSRVSGEPYISHPLEVARILAELRQDPETVCAGLLHDTVEDTSTTLGEIDEHFGEHVAELVDGVTKLAKIDSSNTQIRQAESYRKMLIAMSRDIRVIIIKLADRLHNALTLHHLPQKRRERIARETAEIYAPLANRIGLGWLKGALEDVAFKHLRPREFLEIDEMLRDGLEDREAYMERVIADLNESLGEAGVSAEASARFKLHSSIYEKMQTQNLDFHQVYDICGVRVIVDDAKDCYAVLGVLHSRWTPIPGRFKDYIALPKANLYQSLHTTVLGPAGQRVEFQIRTREMHRVADEGIAAHWKYKGGEEVNDDMADKFEWLRRIVESLSEEADPRNLVDSVKVNLFQDEVFVFTPRGDVKSFPRGATPVDFAFSIHTDLGSRCVGAKINGKIAPLSRLLENGDIVEIFTNQHRKPSVDWMKFVVTARAKQKIRNWIRQEQRERSLTLGEELLEHELSRCVRISSPYMSPRALREAARFFGVQSDKDLLAGIGFGRVSARQVAYKLLPEELVRERERKDRSRLRRLVHRVSRHRSRPGILVKDQDDVLVRYGKCCQPIPGDEIVGFITRGRGVTVHNEDCPNIKALMDEHERLVEVSWGEVGREMHLVTLVVEARDRPGVLASLSAAIAACDANISRVSAEASHKKAEIRLDVQVRDLAHLNEVLKRIHEEKFILSVNRIAPEVAPRRGEVPKIRSD